MKNWRLLLTGLALVANSVVATPQAIDRVAVIVGNGVVLESDIERMMQSIKTQAHQAGQQLPDDRTLHHQIVEKLIMDEILLQLAARAGIQITDEQVDKAIKGIAARNHMNLVQLRSQLAHEGIDYNIWRAQTRKEMAMAEIRNNEVRHRITILPQEVDTLAAQMAIQHTTNTTFNLSQILLPLPENPTQQQVDKQEKLAYRLISEAKNGADFAKLAITWSADQNALKGGAMGWGSVEELPSLFAQSLASAKRGDIIGPIRSGVGFHILKINDIRGDNKNVSITETHARHILLRPSPIMTDSQARSRLQQIATEIRSGKTDFASAAKAFSQDPGSANQGGDMGWNSPEMFDPAFHDALLKLKKGQISAPVHSSSGWHLIELLDTRRVDKTDSVQKERAWRLLFNRKFAEEAQTWMQEQRASTYVKIIKSE